MKKLILTLIFSVLPIFVLFPQDESNGGILYGDNWAYITSAPEGWIMDQESMAHYGIYALFYERGKKFGYPTPIIYINTNKLKGPSDEALMEFIVSDLERNKISGSTITELNKQFPEFTKYNHAIYYMYNIINSRGQYETILYTRFKETGFLIVLNTPNIETLNNLFPKMEKVIEKVRFIDKN